MKKAEVVKASALPEVLPSAAQEVLPAAVYAKDQAPVQAAEAEAKFNLQTGEGFAFRGSWTFDWLDLPASEPSKGSRADVVPAPPPPVFALRTDRGAQGESLRCY